jgi:hypothetical protein
MLPVRHQVRFDYISFNHDFYVYTTYGLYKGNPVPSNSMYLVTSDGVVCSIHLGQHAV